MFVFNAKKYTRADGSIDYAKMRADAVRPTAPEGVSSPSGVEIKSGVAIVKPTIKQGRRSLSEAEKAANRTKRVNDAMAKYGVPLTQSLLTVVDASLTAAGVETMFVASGSLHDAMIATLAPPCDPGDKVEAYLAAGIIVANLFGTGSQGKGVQVFRLGGEPAKPAK